MNDWAKKAAEKLKSHQKAKAIADEKFVQEQRIKQAQGQPLWDDVRDAVRRKCEEFNAEMGKTYLIFQPTASHRIVVNCDIGDGPRTLDAEFFADQHRASWKTSPDHGKGRWILDVSAGIGQPVFIDEPLPHYKTDPEAMATRMLDALLRN